MHHGGRVAKLVVNSLTPVPREQIQKNDHNISWQVDIPLATQMRPFIISLTDAADVAMPIHHFQAVSNCQHELSAGVSVWQVETSHCCFTLQESHM